MLTYEGRLKQNLHRALAEGSLYFERASAVFRVLARITRRLDGLGVSYAVIGDLALFEHGYRRFTETVDLLVTPEGLSRLHAELKGRGWVTAFPGSRNLRDVEDGVRVRFFVTGEFPGDGKPRAIAFPDPVAASAEVRGVRYLSLPWLIGLNLSAGTGLPFPTAETAIVQEVIKALDLPIEFAEQLDPAVREQFKEIWTITRNAPRPDWEE
jgi:hypothetical protein